MISKLMAMLRGAAAPSDGTPEEEAARPPLTANPEESGEQALLDALGQIEDPELGVDIISLGLVRVAVVQGDTLSIEMTLTSPACPVGPWLKEQVAEAAQGVFPEHKVIVTIVHEPPWSPKEMSPAARRELGY